MRVRQSVREKNNGRVCRHSRARVGSFDWDKKRLSLLSKAEHLKIVSSSSAGTKKETNDSTNEKKKEEKKPKPRGRRTARWPRRTVGVPRPSSFLWFSWSCILFALSLPPRGAALLLLFCVLLPLLSSSSSSSSLYKVRPAILLSEMSEYLEICLFGELALYVILSRSFPKRLSFERTNKKERRPVFSKKERSVVRILLPSVFEARWCFCLREKTTFLRAFSLRFFFFFTKILLLFFVVTFVVIKKGVTTKTASSSCRKNEKKWVLSLRCR